MSSEYSSLAYRIAFASLQGMGVDLARKLLDVVGSEEQFFFMKEKELRALTQGRSKIYSDNYRLECLQRAVQEEAFVRDHGIKATYFKDYPINDTLALNVTLLQALDSAGWRTLRNDFNIAELDPALQQLIDSGLDPLFTLRVNKDDYTQSVDSTCPNSQLLAFSYKSQFVTLFHVTNKEEIHAVLYHNLDISTKQ